MCATSHRREESEHGVWGGMPSSLMLKSQGSSASSTPSTLRGADPLPADIEGAVGTSAPRSWHACPDMIILQVPGMFILYGAFDCLSLCHQQSEMVQSQLGTSVKIILSSEIMNGTTCGLVAALWTFIECYPPNSLFSIPPGCSQVEKMQLFQASLYI